MKADVLLGLHNFPVIGVVIRPASSKSYWINQYSIRTIDRYDFIPVNQIDLEDENKYANKKVHSLLPKMSTNYILLGVLWGKVITSNVKQFEQKMPYCQV